MDVTTTSRHGDGPGAAHNVREVQRADCCVVGAGPAGAVLALLLARRGISVLLLEAHGDFEREFRGDTIHPSVMEIMEELGLAERLLEIRHTKIRSLTIQTDDGPATIADFSRLKTDYPFITFMPQARFLEFITAEASRFPQGLDRMSRPTPHSFVMAEAKQGTFKGEGGDPNDADDGSDSRRT